MRLMTEGAVPCLGREPLFYIRDMLGMTAPAAVYIRFRDECLAGKAMADYTGDVRDSVLADLQILVLGAMALGAFLSFFHGWMLFGGCGKRNGGKEA
jgi:hypothetical protein